MCVSLFLLLVSRTLLWRHNGRDYVSNHQYHDYLLNHSFTRRSKKTSKLRVTDLCAGNAPVTGEFPAQMASNAENASLQIYLNFISLTCLDQRKENVQPCAHFLLQWCIMRYGIGALWDLCNRTIPSGRVMLMKYVNVKCLNAGSW